MYDAIVVGARVAGAPTAMLLARRGYRVLLLDRDQFPSDTMSTHYIHKPGVAKLQRWGVLDRVLATGAPPIEQLSMTRAGTTLVGSPAHDEVAFSLCPRRYALDNVLVQAAVEAGAELRENVVVDGVLREGDTVVGIRGHVKGGAAVEERARIVIGADGVHSVIAREVAAQEYNVRPPAGCGYYTYYRDVPMNGAEIAYFDDCIVFGFPTNDGRVCVAVEFPDSRFSEVKQDYEGAFARGLARAEDFAARVAQGTREGALIGVGHIPNYFRAPSGPGWALVGDAGYHKDPVTGQGITDAFVDAEWLAEALDAGWSGQQPLAEALAAHQQRRDARAMPLYEFTMQNVSFTPPAPEMVMLMQALQGNQEDTNRLLSFPYDSAAMRAFMQPDNLGRIIVQARRQGRSTAA